MKKFKVEDLIEIYTINILISKRRNLCTFLLRKLKETSTKMYTPFQIGFDLKLDFNVF